MIGRIEKFGTLEGFADSDLVEMLKVAKELLEPLPCLLEIVAPVIIFGDIHGQLADLMQFTKEVGRLPDFQYLFLGDYVDRATKSLEVIVWLFCMKILYPKKVHLLRGNHEIRRVNAVYGFKEEMLRKRNIHLWKIFNDVFSELPLCASINRKILCMHGGISTKIESWLTLAEMSKPRAHGECEQNLPVDLMWSDPNRKEDKCSFNVHRGISSVFGKTAIEDLCQALDIDLIIRAHEVKENGHEFDFDNRLLTVFSAPYYAGNYSNSGSVVTISRSLKLQIVSLKPTKGHDTLKLEKQTRMDFEKSFQPMSDDPKKITCQYNFPENRTQLSPYLGTHSMFAHETKNCQKTDEIPSKPPIRDEVMSLESIRQKLGMLIKEKKPVQDHVKTPSPDAPPPPPSPPIPRSPPNSSESA
uniref:Serine/threonine-protein phosphatase n=1 Tax=Caenorhabditis tropicalis TaxID=1561998 RepID=A0A1I7U618_9PELO